MDSTDPWGTLGAHVVEAKGARGARVGGGVSVVSLAHSKFGWGEQRVGNRVSRRPCGLTPTARCGADLCQTCNFPDEVPSTTGGPCHSTRLGGAPLRPLASACRCPAPTAHRFRATRRAARLRSSTAPSSPRTTLASGCADTCLRTVRTGCVYRPPCVPYAPEAQGSLARGRHCCTCAVCVPALGVPCVPRTVCGACRRASDREDLGEVGAHVAPDARLDVLRHLVQAVRQRHPHRGRARSYRDARRPRRARARVGRGGQPA